MSTKAVFTRDTLFRTATTNLPVIARLCVLSILPLLFLASVHAQPSPTPSPAPENGKPFTIETVEEQARALLNQPYAQDTGTLPEILSQLNYDQYRDIRYKPDKSLWRNEDLPFQLQFFHRGFLFRDRVIINVIDGGKATPIAYSSELFDYGNNQFTEIFPGTMGFAGIRILHPLRRDKHYDEIAVFLGASYLRAVGAGQAWGISARGLAIDTGMSKAEEFPIFREFWIEKPTKDSTTLTVYALLDSQNATGAYRFSIRPGLDLVMDVKARIFLRNAVDRLGIAPLTSMFFHGENTDRFMDDFRPEVHDSDGLLISMRNGEWVWRPINNPKRLRVSAFQGDDLHGFGLMQRDREYEHYQDLEAMYQLRPSAWVETVGDWGAGVVQLIEIPSDAEKYDNIVAFWVPAKPTAAGQDWSFEYKLHFMLDRSPELTGGKTIATRIGASGTDTLDARRRKFVVEFTGDKLRALSADASVEPILSATSGRIKDPVVHKNQITGDWRLSFEFEPEPGQDPVDFRAYLKVGEEVLTETWLGQWNAPLGSTP
jgi:glucans biosynthesis protein